MVQHLAVCALHACGDLDEDWLSSTQSELPLMHVQGHCSGKPHSPAGLEELQSIILWHLDDVLHLLKQMNNGVMYWAAQSCLNIMTIPWCLNDAAGS